MVSIEAGNCRACGRPFSPTHDVDAPGPTSRHIYRPVRPPEPEPEVPRVAGYISVRREDLKGDVPSLLGRIYAELAGERPGCACRPIRAWPDGPVSGYSELCDAHRDPPITVSGEPCSDTPPAPPGLVEPFPGIAAMVPMVNTTAADREDAPSIRRDLAHMECVMRCPDRRPQPCPDCPLAPFTLDLAPPED